MFRVLYEVVGRPGHVRGRAGALAGHVDLQGRPRAGEESAKAAQAIAAFQSLAERLEAVAEARRPWWRRLVG
jgi:hypothetical protein